jgi:hypothetical protein
MRLTNDEFRAAVRAFFDTIPVERLRALALQFLADPFTNSQRQPRRPGRPRKAMEEDVDEGKVVSLHQRTRGRRRKAVAGRDVDEERVVSLHQRNPRRRKRRKPAVDEAKLAERRKRAAANRRAARAAAKAAMPASNGNGQDRPVTAADLWRHAERIEPQAPWKAVAREFGVKDIHAQHAYRNQSLPPHVGAMAITKFLTLPVAN